MTKEGWGGVVRVFYEDPPAFQADNNSYLQHVPEASRTHFEGIGSFNDLATKFVEMKTAKPEGAFDPNGPQFRDFLPKDLVGQFDTVPTFEALVRGAAATQKMVGVPADQIMRRPATGDSEGMLTHLRSLGAPETVEGYKIENLPEGVKIDEAFQGKFFEASLALGLMPHQVQGLVTFMGEAIKGVQEKQTALSGETVAQNQAALAKMWGVEAGSQTWKENLRIGAGVVEEFGGEEALDVLDQSGLADHPAIIEMFRKIGAARKGTGIDGTGGNGPAMSSEAAQIQSQIQALNATMMEHVNNQRPVEARQVSEQVAALRAKLERLNKK